MKTRRFYEWVRRLHMYSGLLTFMAFVVWGVTGIHAVFLAPPDQYRPPPVSSVRDAVRPAADRRRAVVARDHDAIRFRSRPDATTCIAMRRIWRSTLTINGGRGDH
jgi:hypothetical protein